MNYANTLLSLSVLLFAVPALADSRLNSHHESFTEPSQSIQLAPADSGIVSEVSVKEGDQVRSGDLICSLRSDVLLATRQATLARLNGTGELDAAEATLAHRTHHYRQLVALRAKDHASEQEVSEAEFNVTLATAKVQAVRDAREVLKAELQQIDAKIRDRQITAPADGIVSKLSIEIGERVDVSGEPIAEIVSLDQLRIRHYLPTEVARRWKVGMLQTIEFPGTRQSAQAIIDFIAPITDSSSGTVRVELLLDNVHGEYRSGVRTILIMNELAPLGVPHNALRDLPVNQYLILTTH